MDDYKYKSLDADEVSLLNNWETLTGESLESSRVKLKNPETRNGFLGEISRIATQDKLTAISLLETLSTMKATNDFVQQKMRNYLTIE